MLPVQCFLSHIQPNTVNVEIFAKYIFSCISRMVSDTRKFDVSENLNHYKLNGIRYERCENMPTRKLENVAQG